MKYTNNALLILFSAILLVGCAAMGVPETNDPAKKIGYAYQLFDESQRPLPAEELIRESIEIYKSKEDNIGLAEAYRAYGFFFRSAAIEKWNGYYKSNGFMEKDATYETRYDKSIEYFEKAELIYLDNQKYDALTNIYLNMGFTYEFAKNNEEACTSYKKSLTANQKHLELHPNTSMNLPDGFETYEDYLKGFFTRLACK